MKELTIIGHLGQDAKLNIHNNKQFINFSVAVTDAYKNQDGHRVEKTTWFECFKVVDQGGSTKIMDYLKKGQQIYVRGDIDLSVYMNKENKPAGSIKLKADRIKLLGSKSEGGNTNQAAPNTTNQVPANTSAQPAFIGDDNDNDLPF